MSTPEPRADEPPRIPDALPVLPLKRTVVFPMTVSPLLVGQPRSVRLVDDVMRGDRLVALVAQRDLEREAQTLADLRPVGTAGIVHQLARTPNGTLRVVVQGIERVRLLDLAQPEPYLVARIATAPERVDGGPDTEARRRAVVDLFRQVVQAGGDLPEEVPATVEHLTDPRQVAYLVASVLPFEADVRQELLELDSVDAKLARLIELLQRELAVREVGRRITDQTKERLTKSQRDAILREQLRSIQSELGEGDDSTIAPLREKLDAATLPDEVRREADRELDRLATMPPASPEYGMIRTFLEWLAALPWARLSAAPIDLARTRRVLDEDHYDLEKVKDRILEYLAVRRLRQERAGDDAGGAPPPHEPILCFVGPPGVGKTSLGQSIARALERKFVRMSLGGVRDEAEIRGHRRTYIGALPGRIIQGLRRAETRDPVFMLDEIDKVGADWRGDPSAALLEVLDPAQNHTFVDNYLGVPFDLSQVLFIATANTLDTIPAALRDRMEVLRLAGYTDEEKVSIGERYLVPKERAAAGLRANELSIARDALMRIAREYTREAGVRELDRQIGTVARKVALRLAEGGAGTTGVGAEQVPDYLGRPRFLDDVAERTDRPGVATGLAWTPVGGDVLFVEATMMPSRTERLVLTGMLGEVMRESAQTALSYVRSEATRFGIDPTIFEGKAVHLHVPAGAIPKDGPSAGVTMATALVSLATGRPVRSDVAMTGEITLRGKVLPVGGIKEKVLAAHRFGVRTVILPRRNEADLEDVPEELRRELTVVPADTVEDVVGRAIEVRAGHANGGSAPGMAPS